MLTWAGLWVRLEPNSDTPGICWSGLNLPRNNQSSEKGAKTQNWTIFRTSEHGGGLYTTSTSTIKCDLLRRFPRSLRGLFTLVLQSCKRAHRSNKRLSSAVVNSCTEINATKVPVYPTEQLLGEAFFQNVETRRRFSSQLNIWQLPRSSHNSANIEKPHKREEVPHSTSEGLMTGSADCLPLPPLCCSVSVSGKDVKHAAMWSWRRPETPRGSGPFAASALFLRNKSETIFECRYWK